MGNQGFFILEQSVNRNNSKTMKRTKTFADPDVDKAFQELSDGVFDLLANYHDTKILLTETGAALDDVLELAATVPEIAEAQTILTTLMESHKSQHLALIQAITLILKAGY